MLTERMWGIGLSARGAAQLFLHSKHVACVTQQRQCGTVGLSAAACAVVDDVSLAVIMC